MHRFLLALSLLPLLAAAPALAQDVAQDVAEDVAQDVAPNVAEVEVPAPPTGPFDLEAAISDGAPMTADRAAALARQSSPSIEQARALSRAAAASVAETRAAMLPRLDVTARYAHIDGFPDGTISTAPSPEALATLRTLADSVSDPAARALWQSTIEGQANGGVTIAIPRDQLAFGARLTWPVSDLFFAILPAVEASEANARAREHQASVVESQVGQSARDAFYQLARARGGFAVATEARRQAEAQRAAIEAAARAGFLTSADQLSAEARVASTDQAVASARAGVVIADAALRMLIGVDGAEPYGIGEPLIDATPAALEPVAALTERALAQRAELDALRESLTAQRAAARASDARGYPRLALYGAADLANPNRYQIPPRQEFTPSWELGATLAWSPNDALAAFHRGQALGEQHAATEAQLEQVERGVRLEVRQAHALIEAALESLQAAQVARRAAEAAYARRLAQLRAGSATSADVFSAEGQLNAARLSVLDAAVQHRMARARLVYAVGE